MFNENDEKSILILSKTNNNIANIAVVREKDMNFN